MTLASHASDPAGLPATARTGLAGRLNQGLSLLARTRPSPARGLILGLLLSTLIWAAILGFVTTF